jgi:hypothetical protein
MAFIRRESPKSERRNRAKRTFTPAEADRALVLVKRIVVDVIFEYSRLLDLQETLEAAESGGAVDQYDQIRVELLRAAGRLRTCLEELEDIGVELKDWSLGVVDFPCVSGGRQVCLCWQYGEDSVGHWHEMDTGFGARQPIATLPTDGQYEGEHQAAAASGGSQLRGA